MIIRLVFILFFLIRNKAVQLENQLGEFLLAVSAFKQREERILTIEIALVIIMEKMEFGRFGAVIFMK